MIISRQHFDLNSHCVIEKLVIKTPFRYCAVFQEEACFLYFKEGQSTLSSPIEKINILINESVLLKCSSYFADLIQNADSGVCEIYAIHLHSKILKEIYKDEVPSFIKQKNKAVYAQKIVSQSIVSHFIESLTFYFENPDLVNPALLELKLKELILLLLQTKNAETILELIMHLFNPRQATISEIINTHLYSDFSIDQLAVLAGQSLSTFKREFQANYNDTPANYIKVKRLLRAAELLALTDLSVGEICYKIGFNDISHFSHSFSKQYNSSPSEYRLFNRK